jgi:hypothetical protein
VGIIKNLNSAASKPTNDPNIEYGLDTFMFREAAHVVLYVKNPRIEIDKAYPMWFGENAMGTLDNGKTKKGAKNHTFYNTFRIDNLELADGNSEIAIYSENHFTTLNWIGRHRKIKKGEYKIYSLNINAETLTASPPQGAGGRVIRVPFIIDPDTGNMGEDTP